MQRYSVHDHACWPSSIIREHTRRALFVHCGVLTVGIRRKLGLPAASTCASATAGPACDRAAHPRLPIIVPHFGAGMFREALMVADLGPMSSSTVELEH